MKILVKPKAGLKVVDPTTGKALPTTGLVVEDSTYWRRRERDGDVAISAPPTPKATTTTSTGSGGA